MAAGGGARNEGGRGGGRAEASRQSRRQQGLPPEEVADLDAIQKAARKAKAEQRKAVLLEKEAAAEGQSAPEPPIREDAHQATLDGHSQEEVEPEGESGLDEPAKTSEGGVNEEVSQAEGRVSDSPLPGQDDQGELAVLEDKPLPTVLEEATSQDVQVPANLDAKPSTDEADQDDRVEVPTRRQAPSKRRQNEPPWPVSPVMSIDDVAVSESLLGSMSSRRESSTMSGLSGPAQVSTADPVPHSVGTSGESMGAASGSYASRNSSASLLERVTAGIGALAMSAQTAGGDMSGGMGLYVTKEVVPYPETAPNEDVTVKLEQAGKRPSKSRQVRRQRTRSGRDSSPSGDSSDSDSRRRRRHARSRRRSPRRPVREPSSSGYSTRSRHSHRSGRFGRSSSSVSSGLAEVAVSTFNQVQRMNEVLTRLDEKLPNTTASPNHDGEVQRMLADAVQRAREAEWRAQEAERRLFEAPTQGGPDHVKADPAPEEKMVVEDTPAKAPVDVEAVIQAAVLQAAQAERVRVETAAEDFIRQQQAEADARHEAERAAWAEETQRNLVVMQQKLEALEVARVQEKEAATNMQRYQAERIRTLQATPVAQAQPDRATIAPESATPVKTEVNHPHRATRMGGAIKRNVISGDTGNATQDVTKPGLKNLSEVAIAQLRATLPDVDFSRLARGFTQSRAPAEARAATPTPKVTQVSATRTETSQRAPRQQEVKKELKRESAKEPSKEPKKPERKRPSKRPRDNDDPPADPDPDPDSDGGGGDSDDSYDSLDEDLDAAAAGRPAVAAGSTILTVHPYVNSQLLAKFDEKATRGDRRD